jgi:pSer/pThr/pTyr-binding forkhead associated (FHA) protein
VPFTIGRSVDDPNSLSLDEDTSVSRKHAEISYENNAFYLTDTGSSNGTTVNGQPLTPDAPLRLQDGATIIFGKNTEATFRTSGATDGDQTFTGDDPDRTDYVDMSGTR